MDVRSRRRLIAVNSVLAAGVLALAMLGRADARPAQPDGGTRGEAANRSRGNYTMVSGNANGSPTDIIYIIDASNQEMVALRWDRNGSRFEAVGYRDFVADARQQRGVR